MTFKNFHVPGMHYINLQRSEDLTVKLYITDPQYLKPVCKNYLVSPHDHKYNFKTIVLSGWMRNITFEQDDNGTQWNTFKYYSPLCKKNKDNDVPVVSMGTTKMVEASNTLIPAQGSYMLSHRQVHTIALPDNKPALLLLFQKRDEGKEFTSLFLEGELNTDQNTYEKFTNEEFEDVINMVRNLLNSSL